MSSSPVETKDLCRHFAGLNAVNGINISLGDGEIFGFLGPNGAGKTTTVRMLTTLLLPSSGEARIAGFDVVKQPDMVRKNIGVALQEAAIDPLMTGNELLKLQSVLHGIPRSRVKQRMGELLERVDLVDAADRKVGTYSGGMKRRLDLALSLVHSPKVLFLDEPTTGLDPTSRKNLWEEVRSLNQDKGTTVFLTTQYLEEADILADRVAIIDDGHIVREGKPSVLKSQVGAPTLSLEIEDENHQRTALEVLGEFGEKRPYRQEGIVEIGLEGGAEMMAEVVRVLDKNKIQVKRLELEEPSLDDVFADATGRYLEPAEDASASTEESKEAQE